MEVRALRFFPVFICVIFIAQGTAFAAPAKLPAVPPAEAEKLAPHRALYDIRLTGTKSGSQIVDIKGQMLYEWQPSCEGWISNHRFNLNYDYADTPSMRIASDFSTFETFDGRSFNFSAQRRRDGELIEELRGSASLDDTGKGKAVYTLPEDLRFELPDNSVFPVSHTLRALKSIEEGKKFFSAVIFDGSDQEGPVEVNAVIGKKMDASSVIQPSKNIAADLILSPAWQIRLAFFPLKDSEESSDYEMSILFHENGIISDMSIEYDDFSIRQKLVALEPMKSLCETSPKQD
ncbi:MAG: cell envelope integrity EipB family protein [Alphaproteobacteria bacterium]|nr:cell envelope integrity EipB family protein [Alphaproteobacteria bacterium]